MSDTFTPSIDNIPELIKQGYMALDDRNYELAKSNFNKALSLGDTSSKTYLGLVFATMHVSGIDGIRKSLDASGQYPKESVLTIIASYTDNKRMQIIHDYVVPGYFHSFDIESILEFNCSYISFTSSWESLLNRAKDKFYSSEMSQLMEHADDELKSQLDNAWSDICATYQTFIDKCSHDDEVNHNAKIDEFDKFIESRLPVVKERNKQALARREADYIAATELYRSNKAKAVELFKDKKLLEYKNSSRYIEAYDNNSAELDKVRNDYIRPARVKALSKRAAKILSVVLISCITLYLLATYIPMRMYMNAIDSYYDENYNDAKDTFEFLGDYKGSCKWHEKAVYAMKLSESYQTAQKYYDDGEYAKAVEAFDEIRDYKDSNERFYASLNRLLSLEFVSAGEYHTVGLKDDGTVVAAGSDGYGRCNVSAWKDIVAVSAGENHTVGLKKDGTVVAVGSNGSGQCDVSGWKDIVAVSAGGWHTVGLKRDGTVVAVGKNDDDQCNVSEWKNIVAISAGGWHTVGLKRDGTVVAVGSEGNDKCDVSEWEDIVAVSAGYYHTVGLKRDGSVVAVGEHWHDQCDVFNWQDIVAVSAGYYHTVGLKRDGTVVAVGSNGGDQCDVSGWKNMKVPE